jgi:hypothetical protein
MIQLQGREGIGLVNTLAGMPRGGKSKKFMDAIRCLILQELIHELRIYL